MFIGGDPAEAPLFVNGQPKRHSYDRGQDPSDKEPRTPRRMKGKWDESSVEQELPIIKETRMVLDSTEKIVNADKNSSVKKNLRLELEKLGWIYNGGATFKANFPFRSKHLIFHYAFTRKGASNIHRINVVIGNNGVSGYKLMKWVPK